MMSDDLMARLEQSSGPCRELDALIWWEAGPGKTEWPHYADRSAIEACGIIFGRNPHCEPSWDTVGYRGPTYTASIDAALTLVDAETDPLDILEGTLASCRDERDGVHFLPLHICIAALRARNAGGGL